MMTWTPYAARRRAVALLAALTLTGCTGGGDPGAGPSADTDAGVPPSTSSAPSSAASITPVAVPDTPPPTGQCSGPKTPSTGVWLQTDSGALIDTAVVGDSVDVVVFLHQTNESYCGFWAYAAWLETQDVRSVLVNFCGYGASVCPAGVDWVGEAPAATKAAVAWARDDGAERVMVLGASLGGTVAVAFAGTKANASSIDAVADLSGPVRYGPLDAPSTAAAIAVPAIFAVADGDTVVSVEATKALADAAQGTPTLLVERPAADGHGWDLLDGATTWSVLGLTIRDWAQGDYT